MHRPGARYDPPVRWLLIALTACSSQELPAFTAFGPVQNVLQPGSTLGLWDVRTPEPLTYNFGTGQASTIEFFIDFDAEPPDAALEAGQFGVAFVGMLPGNAIAPEGPVEPGDLRLIGSSTDSAVIFKQPGASGPAWLAEFPDGFACGLCVRDEQPNRFAPVDCTFVTIEAAFLDRCMW